MCKEDIVIDHSSKLSLPSPAEDVIVP